MSASKASLPGPPSDKPRSPVERGIVWGGIVVLLALVAAEYTAREAHSKAVNGLLAKLKAVDESEEAANSTAFEALGVKAADVKAAVGNKLPVVEDVKDRHLANGGKRVEIYRWFTVNLLKPREMYVYYGAGEDADVVTVSIEPDTESSDDLNPALTREQIEQLREKAAAGNTGVSQNFETAPSAEAPPTNGAISESAEKESATEEEPAPNEEK